MLQLRGVAKSYRDGDGSAIDALAGVDLDVAAGEMVALYGPSGSGKTTLLAIIAAILRPDRGQVLVDGIDVSGLTRRELDAYRRQVLGYITQTPDLFAGVPIIAQAPSKLFARGLAPRQAVEQITPLLERLGLGERLRHKPEQLSAGERQRVAIARALATGPRLVVADEPTAALDTARSRAVLELLRELCVERDVALLLATHDERAADHADRSIALVDGQMRAHAPDPAQAR